MTVPSKIFDFLIEPIRSADRRQGHDFLRRYLEGFQSVWETTDAKIFDVTKLWSITDCPNEQLAFLKQIVGWTNDLDNITRELSYDELRRLIAISMRIWKRRSTESSIEDILFFATGARARVWNWFFFRWMIGETLFGEEHEGHDPWLVPDAGEDGETEYLSQLRIVDDGTLNRTLVMNLLRLMRACSERWEVIYLAFLDTFLVAGDSTQWTADNAPHLLVANNAMTLGSSGIDEYTMNLNDFSIGEGVFNIRCKTNGNEIDLQWLDGNGDRLYYLRIGADSDASSSYLTLIRYVDETPENLFAEYIPSFPVHKNVFYMFRTTFTHEVDGRVRIQFFIDGNEMINEVDDQFVPEGGEPPPPPETGIVWYEEQPIDDNSYYWMGCTVGGDATPVMLAWIDGGRVYRGDMVGSTISWAEVQPIDDGDYIWFSGAVSYDGLIMIMSEYGGDPYISYDGGTTWESTGWVSPWYNWVYAIGGDNLTVARAAYNEYIYISSDLGVNWDMFDPDESGPAAWSGIAIGRDPDIIFASSQRLWLTVDGGDNWIELRPFGNIDVDWSGVSIAGDNQTITACVYDGPVLYSPDLGLTWYGEEPTIDGDKITEAFNLFMGADGLLGFIVDYDRLFRSDDLSAAPIYTGIPLGQNGWGGLGPYGRGSIAAQYRSISVSYDKQVVIAEGYGDYCRISSDGGYTWSDLSDLGNDTTNKVAVGLDSNFLFCASYGKSCSISTDQGANWSPVSVAGHGAEEWRGAAVGRDSDVMAACYGWGSGYAFFTDDGWSTYTLLDPRGDGGESSWADVCIAGDDLTIVLTDDGYGEIYVSQDGGATWDTPIVPPDFPHGAAISQDGTTLYVAGTGHLWSTTDWGSNWTEEQPLGDVDGISYYRVACGGDTDPVVCCITDGKGAFINPALDAVNLGTYSWAQTVSPYHVGGG